MCVWKSAGGFMDPQKLQGLGPVLFWRPLRHFDLECVRWMSGFLHIYRVLRQMGMVVHPVPVLFSPDFCTGVSFLVMVLFW